MKKTVAIDLRALSFVRYEQHILRSIDLTIFEGDFIVLLGPNGSGKSTLLKAINGVVRPTGGHILIQGQTMVGRPVHDIAALVSTLTQDVRHSTFSELSVLMNMELALTRTKNHGGDLRTREDIALYVAGFNPSLKDRLDVEAGHLSGGQRQALALALCFAHQPYVLLLDEHTSALDPKAAQSLMTLTDDQVQKKQLTTVMITHSLEHALTYGNRLLIMNEGRIVVDVRGTKKSSLSKSDLIAMAY